jgi:hypothetical protein
LQQLKPLFVQILLLAKTLGFLKLGKVSLDGSNQRLQTQCPELGPRRRSRAAAEPGKWRG